MIIGEDFVFVHNPKTAGSAIREALSPYGEPAKMHGGLFPTRGLQSKTFRIVVVRNPYDRLVSGYHYKHAKVEPEARPSFKEWILDEEPWMVNSFDFKRQLQSYWSWGCNRVLLFENIEQQFNQTMAEMGCEARLIKKKNVSVNRGHWREYFDQETFKVVNDRFAPDFKEFGYDKEI